MPLRDTLQTILADYANAKASPFKGHPLGDFIRHAAADAVLAGLGEHGAGLFVEGSAGAGNWAAVPWIAVFDPAITVSATRGYYVVYLFHATEAVAHLSLNQGTTKVREEFGARTREILQDRAELMRKRVPEFDTTLPIKKIELGAHSRLPGDYVAGHALGATYSLAALPDEATLRADLQAIARAYRALTYRGGIDADVETQTDLSDEFNLPSQISITETRKYVYHRKIERNSTAARNAKKFHGTRCQACELDFGERYGKIGQGFIEAHHLRPIATLEEGVQVKYDVASDFAVLCANCHRMIHRFSDPTDLAAFRNIIHATPAHERDSRKQPQASEVD
jgi:5-methylcytosine-specific restriction protein A